MANDVPAQLSALQERLEATGSVQLQATPARLLTALLGVVGFTVVGVVLVATDPEFEVQLAGWLAIAFFGVVGIPAIVVQLVRGAPIVTVTRQGVAVARGFDVPWADVTAVGLLTIRRTQLVVLRTTSESAQARALVKRPWTEVLAGLNNAITRGPDLSLPVVDVRADVLATWLLHVAGVPPIGR